MALGFILNIEVVFFTAILGQIDFESKWLRFSSKWALLEGLLGLSMVLRCYWFPQLIINKYGNRSIIHFDTNYCLFDLDQWAKEGESARRRYIEWCRKRYHTFRCQILKSASPEGGWEKIGKQGDRLGGYACRGWGLLASQWAQILYLGFSMHGVPLRPTSLWICSNYLI